MPTLVPCVCCRQQVSNEARVCPHCGQPDPLSESDRLMEARRVAKSGNKINAIKMVREATGWDLKTAKDKVDSW